MKNIKHSYGFTLIELMITLIVLVILTVIAVPSFNSMIRKNQLEQDAQSFVEKLHLARSTAILQKKAIISTDWVFLNSEWSDSPPTISVTFTFMGYLDPLQDLCFVLKSKKDASLKQVVIVSRNGFILYDKTATSCNV